MIVERVIEFRQKFGLPIPAEPERLSKSEILQAIGYLKEEVLEFETHANMALIDHRVEDDEGMLDALADLMFFATGIAILAGWDLEEALTRVHAANMRKERATDTDNKRQSSTDIIKPDGWQPASLRDLVTLRVTTVGEACRTNGSDSVGTPRSGPPISSSLEIVRSSEASPGLLSTG